MRNGNHNQCIGVSLRLRLTVRPASMRVMIELIGVSHIWLDWPKGVYKPRPLPRFRLPIQLNYLSRSTDYNHSSSPNYLRTFHQQPLSNSQKPHSNSNNQHHASISTSTDPQAETSTFAAASTKSKVLAKVELVPAWRMRRDSLIMVGMGVRGLNIMGQSVFEK